MKHLHMLMALLTIALFIYQSYRVLTNQAATNRKQFIATHIIYTILVISGGWMLWQLVSVNAPVQWAVAKIILLIAAISASIKAFRNSATPSQQKVGILISSVAYIGIVILAFTKPDNWF
ncbi:SirB2 family protein [Psychrobacter sp. I-STPA6b]|uniref:SirB2 family protein n=1 Tax=Psychrobacter sp. I-STPA6b TaxID=2585718 RepID=UPI001D0C0E65|nr:SirB2 family protein [Psychrobacter sp. I-STPA6b]